MELEDKKLIAEKLMGWEIIHGMGTWSFATIDKPGKTGKNTELKNWNPDTDHNHFAEVWTKLTPGQQQFVLANCETMDTAEIISALLTKEGLTEFCVFVLEVLKGE